jgi:hypothetical protein
MQESEQEEPLSQDKQEQENSIYGFSNPQKYGGAGGLPHPPKAPDRTSECARPITSLGTSNLISTWPA